MVIIYDKSKPNVNVILLPSGYHIWPQVPDNQTLEDIQVVVNAGIRYVNIYDSVIALALGLNSSIRDLQDVIPTRGLEHFEFTDNQMARIVYDNLKKVNFTGASVSKINI